MSDIYSTPLFGLALTTACFVLFSRLYAKLKSPLANPILLSNIAIISILHFGGIPFEKFNEGGDIITMMLGPVMVALAYAIYLQLPILERHFLPIMAGCFAGSLAAMLSALWLSRLFGIDERLALSMVPKSVTTPIAIEVSQHIGGIPSITVAGIAVTGVLGAMFAPWAVKFFRINDPVAAGVAIGTSTHGVGTSKALEIGPVEGATSGVAIGIAGFMTVLLSLFF